MGAVVAVLLDTQQRPANLDGNRIVPALAANSEFGLAQSDIPVAANRTANPSGPPPATADLGPVGGPCFGFQVEMPRKASLSQTRRRRWQGPTAPWGRPRARFRTVGKRCVARSRTPRSRPVPTADRARGDRGDCRSPACRGLSRGSRHPRFVTASLLALARRRRSAAVRASRAPVNAAGQDD